MSAALMVMIVCIIRSGQGQQTEELQYKIQEEQLPFTFVGNIANDSNISAEVTPVMMTKLRFQIWNAGTTAYDKLFRIHESTGRLETATVIDREQVCQPTSNCILSLGVAVFKPDNELIKVIRVLVTIEDINDNVPLFPQPFISLQVSESSEVGHILLTNTAHDRDSGSQNSALVYELLSGQPTFSVKPVPDVDSSENLGIVVEKKLDREVQDFYQLVIVAKDTGTPQRNGTLRVNITVLDANDNRPSFLNSSYNITISEDQAEGTVILRLSADDEDIGDNGRITYEFSSRTSSQVKETFYLNETNGEITIKNLLDYEQETKYQFVVFARDNGIPSLSTQVIVNITVLDVNDNAPQININLPPGGTGVVENAIIGQYIATVIVSDPDEGENGTVNCTLSNDDFNIVKMYSNIFKITLGSRLDRERVAVHNVTINCFDFGKPPKTNKTFFYVNVSDVNDNFPVFSKSIYKVDFPENNIIGDVVVHVSAEDKDEGENGRVTYLFSTLQSDFAINPTSGIITANRVFDRENISNVMFQVVARDNGANGQKFSSTATVVVQIQDKNDEYPIFSQSKYDILVAEEQPINKTIAQFSASDRDRGINGEFTFQIEEGFSKIFTIDGTGSLKTQVLLDREKQEEYHFQIYVIDKGDPALTSTANVSVYLQDVNDNPPTIYYPNDRNNSISLSLQIVPKTIIARVIANDTDKGVNARLTYQIIQGNINNLFSIDNRTGVIRVERSPTEEEAGTYNLVMAVTDSGDPSKTNWTHLVVIVGEKSNSQNLIIVIVVCSITMVISLALILIICIIRKRDIKKYKDKGNQFKTPHKSFLKKCFNCVTTEKQPKELTSENNNNRYLVPSSGSSDDDKMYTQLVRGSKPELTRVDSGIGENLPPDSGKGDSVDVGSEIYRSDMDLSSIPPSAGFTDKSTHSFSPGHSEQDIPNNSPWHQKARVTFNDYQRNISLDEQMLRRNPKPPIYFARFRSSSESDNLTKDSSTSQDKLDLSHSSSFKHNNIDLSQSYSGPFFSKSLDRSNKNVHFARARPQFSHQPSRSAVRRELPTISASPDPYDPIQELTEISYQDTDTYRNPPNNIYLRDQGSLHDSESQISQDPSLDFKGRITLADSQSQHSNDTTLASFAINPSNFESVFNTDIVV
ncbi:protocadherin-11 X-linked-like [Saccostrea echinata]|uniref:protocadherin-11 X-linked-like n=1 Tax=Saccostrea echinata TaxID=191078 RepID=UPI002A826398|nr:protocadherin-11 X-linked-like [Saccostrea echinata]